MIHLVQPYIDIALKLITGMIGILVFLRITGKAQLAQITPLKGFYFVTYAGDVKRGEEEVAVDDTGDVV